MADCTSLDALLTLQSNQITALKARVTVLEGKAVDEQSVIQKAINGMFSDSRWQKAAASIALIGGLSIGVNDLKSGLTDVRKLSQSAEQIAEAAKGRVADARAAAERAFSRANTVADSASEAMREARSASSKAGSALGKAGDAVNKAGDAASKAGKLSGLLPLLQIVGTLLALAAAAYAIFEIMALKPKVEFLITAFDGLIDQIGVTARKVTRLEPIVTIASEKAIIATEKASIATDKSEKAITFSRVAIKESEKATDSASDAKRSAIEARFISDKAITISEEASQSSREAFKVARLAYQEGLITKIDIDKLDSQLKLAENDISQAKKDVNQAKLDSINADKEHDRKIAALELKPGIKGDKGDKPLAGIDYPIPANGKDGKTPTKGIDYRDGKDGVTTVKTIIETRTIILPGTPGKDGLNGRDGKDGKDANPTELNELKKKVAIHDVQIKEEHEMNKEANKKLDGLKQDNLNIFQLLYKVFVIVTDALRIINKILLAVLAVGTIFPALATILANTVWLRNAVGGIAGNINNLKEVVTSGFTKTWNFLKLDRVLNIMNTAMNIHNAALLSNNVVQSLLSVLDNVVGLIIPKDAEGKVFSASAVLGAEFEGLIKSVLGEQTYEAVKAKWKTFSAIYTAAINVIYSITSMMDAVRSIVEFGASYSGKIGNALKKAGVVFENAYAWMHTDFSPVGTANAKWEKLFTNINNVEQTASGLNTVSADAVSIKDNVDSLKQQRIDLDNAIKPLVNAKAATEAASSSKSQSPAIPESAITGVKD